MLTGAVPRSGGQPASDRRRAGLCRFPGPVELLFDTGFGDLFVVRNAGTMSTGAAIASLEFAVGHLNVGLIVVLGHERCGAIEAAFLPELRITANLAQLVGQLRMVVFALGAADNLAQACRDHCRNAARNLVDSSVLLTDRVRAGGLRVEAAFYNLHSTAIDWLGPVSPQPLGTWEDAGASEAQG